MGQGRRPGNRRRHAGAGDREVDLDGPFHPQDIAAQKVDQRLDLPGLIVVAIAIFALTFGLIEANTYGWTSPMILALFWRATWLVLSKK